MSSMNDINEFDPNLPTDRQPLTEWDQPMDEADAYIDPYEGTDWDEVSDADADWRWETDDAYIMEAQDYYDDEQAFGSAGFGMDETYDF